MKQIKQTVLTTLLLLATNTALAAQFKCDISMGIRTLAEDEIEVRIGERNLINLVAGDLKCTGEVVPDVNQGQWIYIMDVDLEDTVRKARASTESSLNRSRVFLHTGFGSANSQKHSCSCYVPGT